jgi:hypothetical protein
MREAASKRQILMKQIPDLRGHDRAQSSRLAVSFAIDQHRSGHRERCLFQMQPKLLETSLTSTPHAAAVAHHSYRLFSPALHLFTPCYHR